MKKEERIEKYGLAAHKKHKQQTNAWHKKWREENPEKARKNNYEGSRKGGKYYLKSLQYSHTGLRGERTKVRNRHQHQYRPYKRIIDPEGLTQIHHSWLPKSSDCTGVALVEKEAHMHGFIDVIQILEGEITLFTEAEIRGDKYQ